MRPIKMLKYLTKGIPIAALAFAWLSACVAGSASAMVEVEDASLARVSARGIAFNLDSLLVEGGLSLTYTGEGGQMLSFETIELAYSGDPEALFDDPFRLEIVTRAGGLPQAIQLQTPVNANDTLAWSLAADLRISDGVSTIEAGALVVEEMRLHDNRLTLTAPDTGTDDTIMLGTDLQLDVGALALRPGGRDRQAGEFRLGGIHVGGRDSGAWTISSIDNQPVTLRADGGGILRFELDWPKNRIASIGSIEIDDIQIFDALGLPLASLLPAGARVGMGIDRVQLQYVNVRLNP